LQPELTDTQTLLLETVSKFLANEVPLERVRALEASGEMDTQTWDALREQGWLALPFGEALGGGGGSWVDAGCLLEAVSRRAVPLPLLEAWVAGRALEAAGDPDGLVPRLLAGRALPVPALFEAKQRFDETTLVVSDGRLDGTKAFVDYGDCASHHLVSAREPGGPALFLLEVTGATVRCEPLQSIGRTPLVAAHYRGAPARRIGGEAELTALRLSGQALAAVQCVAAMQEALDQTLAYARVREQFGRPIGSFQAVRHHAANMAIEIARARWLVYEALASIDSGGAQVETIALAKASASLAVPKVAMLAHQIYGGNGVIEENDLYFHTLRGKEASLAWGTADECLDLVANEIDQKVDWL
jgi:alkylation response protein AidB-like acyl-CoA dehydrogenase